MKPPAFQFTPAARLYCENADTVDEIQRSMAPEAQELCTRHRDLLLHMRSEAYQSVAAFGDVLLRELSLVPWQATRVQLCEQTTYTVKSWRGQRINYRWLRPMAGLGGEKRPTAEESCIALFFPIPEVVVSSADDTKLRKCFEIITKHQLPVGLVCDASAQRVWRRMEALAQSAAFGALARPKAKGDWGTMSLPLDPSNPMSTVVERVEALLRAIYASQFEDS